MTTCTNCNCPIKQRADTRNPYIHGDWIECVMALKRRVAELLAAELEAELAEPAEL